MILDPRVVPRALGGTGSGHRVIAPGPGHSLADRSGGFPCHSFASKRECRDRARKALGLGVWQRPRTRSAPCRPTRTAPLAGDDAGGRTRLALDLWSEVIDLCGTPSIAVHRTKHNDERTIFNLEVLSRYLAEIIDGR
jgi:hypothetical protein